MKRSTKKRWVYFGIGTGTVALSFFCVLASSLLFRAGENSLYNRQNYEVVNIISSEGLGEPLSIETRLELFEQCQVEGDKREPLPKEINEDAAVDKALILWNEALLTHADGNGVMPSGDYVSDLIDRASVTVTLRDFYNQDSSAKLALWCVQVYCTSGTEDETYCLSTQLDSRTGEPYTLNCALFSNVLPDNNRKGIESFCNALGVTDVDVSGATIDWQEEGAIIRLTLPSGMVVSKSCRYGQEYTFTLFYQQ
ncbi:MAG: hypothetical protein PHT58_04515 [Eubacteriales bacterium]|nr:hypothetical protein [Eubacteriales bacterium]